MKIHPSLPASGLAQPLSTDSSTLQRFNPSTLQPHATPFARAKSRTNKSALFLSCVVILLAVGAAEVRGQSALDGFDPNANSVVRALAVQPDGKILVAGDFTSLSPNGGATVTRNHIARLNPDGTLDTAFNPNADGAIYAIAVQADGKVLAAGLFTNIGGQTRNHMARLDAVTGLADSFNPSPDDFVFSLAVQADGKILVGGVFVTIGGQPRSRVARLDATTGLADSFDPSADAGVVFSFAVQADGKILASGVFGAIGGQFRNNIARLDPFTGAADSFNPNANGNVNTMAIQPDGKILVGGSFGGANSIGGQPRTAIARLDPVTGAADSFNPNANNNVNTIEIQPDGKILVGGLFTSIGGQMRNYIARLSPITGLADSFNPNLGLTSPVVHAIAQQADGKILAGGNFTTITPNGGATGTRNNIARLEIDGRLDQTLNLATIDGAVHATAVQPDGKVLIGGGFLTVLGVARNRIARLNTDGTLDTAFNPSASGGTVSAIAVQTDGKILVGGSFTNIGGQPRNRIARLDATTGVSDSFNPIADSDTQAIVVQADGKILVGGFFTNIGGQTRNYIARLDATTGLADSFNPAPNSFFRSFALQADGKILVGGDFTSIGGQTRNYIARLDSTGLADSFNPTANDLVYAIAVQADNKVLLGGIFTSVGGQTRNYIARLDATTGLADSWNPNANGFVNSIAIQADGKIVVGGSFFGANGIGGQTRNSMARLEAATGLADSFDPNPNLNVNTVALQTDGKILVGGFFTNIGGQARSLFARLTNDTIASQTLAVTQTTVTWTRGGSSPQFTRVTFEHSTDSVNYTFLGLGTATGSNWTLTGLNLSLGQNLFVRARGHYHPGIYDGSESIQQSVRNVFLLAAPTPTPTPTATPAFVSISGTVIYCSDPALPPVSGVTMSLTGPSPAPSSTPTNGSGAYTLSGLTNGGSYTVTPTKATLVPGTSGINTLDAIAIQRHFLGLGTLLTGCRLAAADTNDPPNGVGTTDAIAAQRFFLGLTSGIAQAGRYKFGPVSRSYSPLMGNQTVQHYNVVIQGDVATGYVAPRPE